MRNAVIAIAMIFAAIILIATKPTPEEIAQAGLGKINYTVLNRDSMPKDFLAAVAAAAILEGISQLLRDPNSGELSGPLQWRTNDLVLMRYSDLTFSKIGSLKCLWLLRSGYCLYSKA